MMRDITTKSLPINLEFKLSLSALLRNETSYEFSANQKNFAYINVN